MNEEIIRQDLDKRWESVQSHLKEIGSDVKEMRVSLNSHNTEIKLIENNLKMHKNSIDDIKKSLNKESFLSKHGHKIFVVTVTLIGMIGAYSTWKHDQTVQDKIQNEQLLELKALITQKNK